MHLIIENTNTYRSLISHLLPSAHGPEQAAYLFADYQGHMNGGSLKLRDFYLMSEKDYVRQADDYLELTDQARAKVIKHAHDMGAALVEMHSHPGPWPAMFSYADRVGLLETVPHMKWRLPRRPYVAIVVAQSGFDALVWPTDRTLPEALEGIDVNGQKIRPTNLSLGEWK